jgi:LmbE family N-acetylglucosaminyl deacetylase
MVSYEKGVINMERKKLHIMAVGAHIGDMELTVGGILAKHALMEDRITTVALTAGEKGNPDFITVEDYRKQKIHEANEFTSMLKGQAIVLDYNDGELPDNDEVRFKLCDIIRREKPNILITHWKNSIHKDHRTTYNIVKDAQYYAGVKGFERDNPNHFAAGPYYAENWEDALDFKPYIYVDITEGYELWKKAVSTMWFVTNSKSFKYLEYYDHLSRVRGTESRRKNAQCLAVDPENIKKIIDHF